ncbi:MAG: M1 family metallopeptidase [Gemmatimonadaceae bacterium]
MTLPVAALYLALSAAFTDPYVRQPGIDATHYAFELAVNDSTDRIEGRARVDVRFVVAGQRSFWLDLASVAEGKGMTVLDVTSDGQPVKFEHAGDRLRMTLGDAPTANAQRQFVIRYQGIPKNGLFIGKNKFGERVFMGLNWPDLARQWLPMIDHPSDKATSEFIVTAPSKYQVVANGLLVEETDAGDGRRRTHWRQSVPISSWLNAIGVAQFSAHHAGMVRGVELQSWSYHQDSTRGPATFELPARRAVDFFSDYVGPYPYEKLANVQSAGMGGGTEHASVIFYGETSITDKPATGLVAHEIAHQWFGDAVTESDWDEVWLSEGFATYFTLLYTEHYGGRDEFVTGLQRSRDQVWALEKRLPGKSVLHHDLADMKDVLNNLIYQKGGWTLHMLRGLIGADVFRDGIREYYATYRDRNTTTAEFRAIMEKHSGRELGWFFEQWLARAGHPVLEGTWRYDAATKHVVVELAQTGDGALYRLPLEIGLAGDAPAAMRIERIEMTQRQQHFEIAADKAPASVKLDPNTWTLMEAKLTP